MSIFPDVALFLVFFVLFIVWGSLEGDLLTATLLYAGWQPDTADLQPHGTLCFSTRFYNPGQKYSEIFSDLFGHFLAHLLFFSGILGPGGLGIA